MFTDADFHYNYTWFTPIQNYVTFKARSCNDAHILLSSTRDETEVAYEIVYGSFDNTQTEVRRGSHGERLASVDTPDIMHCDEYCRFWVRWDYSSKLLTVGVGKLDTHVYITLTDEDMHQIQAFTFTSWVDSEGEYQVLEEQSKSTLYSILVGSGTY